MDELNEIVNNVEIADAAKGLYTAMNELVKAGFSRKEAIDIIKVTLMSNTNSQKNPYL